MKNGIADPFFNDEAGLIDSAHDCTVEFPDHRQNTAWEGEIIIVIIHRRSLKRVFEDENVPYLYKEIVFRDYLRY